MPLTIDIANRFGFLILGLTNNFAYVIMLTAAYDLIKKSESQQAQSSTEITGSSSQLNVSVINVSNTTNDVVQQNTSYCNQHSTSAILLADTIPSLTTKILYPLSLVGIPIAYKASATALLSAISFLMAGFASDQLLIYAGVACASLSSGLGESTYLSNSPLFGDVALSGWSMGTGAAGLVGAMAYAILRMILDIEWIMIIMLIVPVSMMYAYFFMLRPVSVVDSSDHCGVDASQSVDPTLDLSIVSRESNQNQTDPIESSISRQRSYGANGSHQTDASGDKNLIGVEEDFTVNAKIRYLPTLSKYFMPLLLVYFAEYFINQGLFELIYYPEISYLDHAAQYRWFQVSYQFGVMLSRSSLDLFRIKQLWTMSILQAVNALLFLAHVLKFIHIPSFYIVVFLIVYEGLLGGFTYANTFYRMKKELPSSKHEFAISTVTIADTLGIVIAGAVAMRAYNALCAVYT